MKKESCLRVRLITHFLKNPGIEYESYQLSKIFNASKSTINGYLLDMEHDSIVARREQGYYCYWKANRSRALTRTVITKPWNLTLLGIDFQQE